MTKRKFETVGFIGPVGTTVVSCLSKLAKDAAEETVRRINIDLNMTKELKNILIVDCGVTLSANQVSENKTLKTFEAKKDFEITATRVDIYTPPETRSQRRKRKRKNR